MEKWKFLPTVSMNHQAWEPVSCHSCLAVHREDCMRMGPTAWQTAYGAGP